MSRNTHVLLYRGLARLATQSGIGEAIRHQQRTLALTGRTVTSQVFGQWDVVHLNTVFPDTPLLVLLARLRRRRVVLWAHSTEEDFRNSFRGSNLLSPLFRRWITLLYRMGDVVITPTAYARDLIRSYGLPGRVRVLSNGVDTQFFTPDDGAGRDFRRRHGIAQDAQLVVSAGLQIARKGILDWIELARSRPQMQFWWFGHTDPVLLDPAVRTAMQGAPDNCVFPGYVPAAELRDAYRAADVFAFLTHEETEGLVLLEALACGAPVLLRDIPLYADWLPDGEVVHKAGGTGSRFVTAAGRTLDAMLNGDLPDLRAAGRRAAQNLDFTAVAGDLDRIYREEILDPPEAATPRTPSQAGNIAN